MQADRRHTDVPTSLLVAGSLLLLFLALPWLLMACRGVGMPGWIYGAEPIAGWFRLWALLPAWLLLGAVAALIWSFRKGRESP